MIIPMKKAQIVVLKEDKDRLLKSLQKSEVLMLISTSEEEITTDVSFEEQTLKRTEASLEIIKKFREKPGFIREEFIIDYDSFVSKNPRRLELLDLIETNNKKIKELETENDNLKLEISFYEPWDSLDLLLSELNDPRYAKVRTGFIPNQNLNRLTEVLDEFGASYKVISSNVRETAIIFAAYIDDDKDLLDKIKTFNFNEINFDKLDFTPNTIIEEKLKQVSNNELLITELYKELEVYAKEVDEILVLADKLMSDKELKTAPVGETYSASYLVGWVRSDEVEKLAKSVKKVTDVYDFAILDPEEDDIVPTATKNNKIVSAFEPITNMFSIPSINDVDPNPVMGFWYWLIFGMMMGDAGYGVALAIIMYLMIKLTKPKGNTLKMYRMFFYGAFATIFWGVMFSSYFGYSLHEPILLNPTLDILEYMILSLAIGGFHLISGYLIKAYADIRDGRLVDAIFDNFPWVFVILGVGLLFIPAVSKVGGALAITGAVLIVLTHGRKSRNIFAKLGGGLYSLYNSVNVFSDILSYSRILALSLSSAIIGMVMNILAEMLQGNLIGIFLSIFVYIIGHAFNLIMGLLSAYVHDSRLQYIEFFGKFYEGGGVEFKPLAMNLKHIDKIEKVENLEVN